MTEDIILSVVGCAHETLGTAPGGMGRLNGSCVAHRQVPRPTWKSEGGGENLLVDSGH